MYKKKYGLTIGGILFLKMKKKKGLPFLVLSQIEILIIY